jgi:GST-like protein
MRALSRAHLSFRGAVMLDLYTARSPVVFKVLIALEEMGLSFRSIPLDVTKGEQYSGSFAAINPNSRIPALVDHAPADGGPPIALGESGAILVYLAEKTGQFLPTVARQRAEVLQWVFWQVASLGPTMGQTRHFLLFAREGAPIPSSASATRPPAV